jgi:hypothetical protein
MPSAITWLINWTTAFDEAMATRRVILIAV